MLIFKKIHTDADVISAAQNEQKQLPENALYPDFEKWLKNGMIAYYLWKYILKKNKPL